MESKESLRRECCMPGCDRLAVVELYDPASTTSVYEHTEACEEHEPHFSDESTVRYPIHPSE